MLKKTSPALTGRSLVPVKLIERRIYLFRGLKVMLDSDLAELYEVPTFRLNEAVKRNRKRFPTDFMFQLTGAEGKRLTSQFAMSKNGRGGRRTSPYVFTEQGVAMLSSVLNSERAILVNVAIMRAFVKLREVMVTHQDLARNIEALERKFGEHDEEIQEIFTTIRQFMAAPPGSKRKIGFPSNSTDKGIDGASAVRRSPSSPPAPALASLAAGSSSAPPATSGKR